MCVCVYIYIASEDLKAQLSRFFLIYSEVQDIFNAEVKKICFGQNNL